MNSQNYSEENCVKIDKRQCEIKLKKMAHYQTSLIYDTLEKVTGLPQIILSSMLSTSSITSLYDEENNEGVKIFIAVASTLLAIITAVSRFFEFAKLKEAHKKTSLAYGKLERFIDVELSKEHKLKFEQLFEQVINEYNNIRESSHLIPKYFPIYAQEIKTNVI